MCKHVWASVLSAKSKTITDAEKGTYTFHMTENRHCVLCGKPK